MRLLFTFLLLTMVLAAVYISCEAKKARTYKEDDKNKKHDISKNDRSTLKPDTAKSGYGNDEEKATPNSQKKNKIQKTTNKQQMKSSRKKRGADYESKRVEDKKIAKSKHGKSKKSRVECSPKKSNDPIMPVSPIIGNKVENDKVVIDPSGMEQQMAGKAEQVAVVQSES